MHTGVVASCADEVIHDDANCPRRPTPAPARPGTEDPAPLRAVHTPNFPALLRQLGASLLVTTYQAGKLVMVRDEGDHLNTHFRAFQAPMGMALATATGWPSAPRSRSGSSSTSRPSPARLEPARPARRLLPAALQPRHRQHPDPRDGLGRGRRALGRQHPVLLPLHARPLGQLRAALAAAVRHRAGADRPLPPERPGRWSTAARATSRRWARPTSRPAGGRTRPGAASLMDVDSGEVITRGLSMPHSPRWYGGRLWVCESGAGTLGYRRPEHRQVRADRRGAGLHPRARLRRQPRLRRAVAGARERRLQRHPDHRAAGRGGADLRRLRRST